MQEHCSMPRQEVTSKHCDDSLRHMQWGTGTNPCPSRMAITGCQGELHSLHPGTENSTTIPHPLLENQELLGEAATLSALTQYSGEGLDLFEETSMPPRQMGGERGVVESSSSMSCNAAQSIFPVFTCNTSVCPSRSCLHWYRLTRTATLLYF